GREPEGEQRKPGHQAEVRAEREARQGPGRPRPDAGDQADEHAGPGDGEAYPERVGHCAARLSNADEQGEQHTAEHRQGDLDESVLQPVAASFELVETTHELVEAFRRLLETLVDHFETRVDLAFELVETD